MATCSTEQAEYWLWIVQNRWAKIFAHCTEQGGQALKIMAIHSREQAGQALKIMATYSPAGIFAHCTEQFS